MPRFTRGMRWMGRTKAFLARPQHGATPVARTEVRPAGASPRSPRGAIAPATPLPEAVARGDA